MRFQHDIPSRAPGTGRRAVQCHHAAAAAQFLPSQIVRVDAEFAREDDVVDIIGRAPQLADEEMDMGRHRPVGIWRGLDRIEGVASVLAGLHPAAQPTVKPRAVAAVKPASKPAIQTASAPKPAPHTNVAAAPKTPELRPAVKPEVQSAEAKPQTPAREPEMRTAFQSPPPPKSLSGAQPVVPAGTFDSRWSAFRSF